MKTWARVAMAAAVLAVGVGVYLVFQDPVEIGGSSGQLRPSTRLVDETGGVQGIGAGERPWANQYDERGELSYRFRAQQYNPLDSGTVNVMAPTFEFYLTGGRRVRLTGETGQVFLPRRGAAGAGRGGDVLGGGQASLPTRGTLQNVQITLLESDSETSSLTAVMDNVIFDNDTLRIWTGDAVINGVPTPGSRIPVTIRGDEYDFDGEGLTIQLAQRGERTIQRVEVARATQLLIKSGDLLRDQRIGLAKDRADLRIASLGEGAWAGLLGQAGVGGGGGGGGGGGVMVRPVADTVYRATIRQGVRVVQGRGTTLTGELMQIDFSSAPRPKAPAPSTARAGAPAPASALPGLATPAPTGAAPGGLAPAPGGLAPAPAASPTPAPEPIRVTWDGPLRVEADAGDPMTPAGEAIVTVFGASGGGTVELVQDGSRAVAPVMVYETGPRRATLQGSDSVPVTLWDDRGSVLTTAVLTYSVPERVAVMTGASVVRASVDNDDAGRPRQMLASWSRGAVVRFEAEGGGRGTGGGRVKSAELSGAVRVDHPELRMTGERLSLMFDPEGRPRGAGRGGEEAGFGGADLREMVAEGRVSAELIGGTTVSTLSAEQLRLTTQRGEDGRVFPDRLESSGNVRAGDGRQTLAARGMVIELLPDTREGAKGGGGGLARVKPQTLSASGDVVAKGEDGSEIRGQTLTVGNLSGERVVYIEGPDASVSAEGNTLRAGRIVYRESDGSAVIPTSGTLEGVQRAERAGERDTPFSVTWKEGARFSQNAEGGRIEVRGEVAFETVDGDGAVATATSKVLTVRLAGGAEASRRDSGGAPQVRMLGQRRMESVELAEDVRLQSLLGDERGEVVRQFNLLAERVRYGADGRVEVPVPGRLLLIDRRPATGGPPAAVAQGNPTGELSPNGRGNTAMKWEERLVYEPADRRLTFDGGVVFVHEPLAEAGAGGGVGGAARRYRLDSDRLTVYLEPGGGRPGAVANLEQAEQVRTVIAQGQVVFGADGLTVTASELEYVPSAQLVLARGSDRVPVRVDEDRALGTGTFSSARINLRTGMVEEVREPRGNVGIGGMPLPAPRQGPRR